MKRLSFMILSVFFISAAECGAVFNVDCGFFGASSPKDGYESSFLMGAMAGVGAGVSVDVKKIGLSRLKLRADINKFMWGEEDWMVLITGMSLKNRFERVPVFAGARFYLPRLLVFNLYADAGLEVSEDTQYADYKNGPDKKEKDTLTGFAAGWGIELKSGFFLLGVNVRYHTLEKSYTSAGPVFGLSF